MSLHNAARAGDLSELGQCLSSNVNVNEVDKHQRTALHLAAWAGHVDVVKALLSAGAKVKQHAMDQMTALHFAAQNGHAQVCRVLITGGIPVNSKTQKGATPLHLACQKGHLDTIKLLLQRKAGLFIRDNKGIDVLTKCKDEACRRFIEQAMDEASATNPFSKKRNRDKTEANPTRNADNIKQDDEGDSDFEDEIPLKRASTNKPCSNTLTEAKSYEGEKPCIAKTPIRSTKTTKGVDVDTPVPKESPKPVDLCENPRTSEQEALMPRPPVAKGPRR